MELSAAARLYKRDIRIVSWAWPSGFTLIPCLASDKGEDMVLHLREKGERGTITTVCVTSTSKTGREMQKLST